MHMTGRFALLLFVTLTFVIAFLCWLYLNVQASLQVSAHEAKIELSEKLPAQIAIDDYLTTHAKGRVQTELKIDQNMDVPLKGKYLAHLKFQVQVPVEVDVDYETIIRVDQLMPLTATTDLIYQKWYLPKLPLSLNIPVRMDVPFRIQQRYQVPIYIDFDAPVYLDLNEQLKLPIRHQIYADFMINDQIDLQKISPFKATMYHLQRQSKANLDMQMNLPLKQIHP